MDNISPEGYFFIYAFPSFYACVKNATQEQISKFNALAVNGEAPSFEELKKIFYNAFRRIKAFKKKEGPYSIEDYRDYWWFEHNRIIDKREEGYEKAMEEEAELCKVSFRRVEGFDNNLVLLSSPIWQTHKAVNYRNLDLKIGDIVSIHKAMVVEKVSEEDYQKLNK